MPQSAEGRLGAWGFAWVLALLFPVRLEYDWWAFRTVSILEVALGILLLKVLVVGSVRGYLNVGNRTVFLLAALPVLFAVLSLIWSVDLGATGKSIVVYGAALATFVVTVQVFQSLSVKVLAFIVVLLPVALIATALASYVPNSILRPELVTPSETLSRPGFIVTYYARLSHPFLGVSNAFGTVLAVLLPLVLIPARVQIFKLWSKWAFIITLGAIIATGSRGVILAVVCTFVLHFGWRIVNKRRVGYGGVWMVGLSLVLAFVFVSLNPIAQEHLSGRLKFDNIESRLSAFVGVFEVLGAYPLGVGSGVSLESVSDVALRSVHNAYLQNVLWFGWVGGLLLTLGMLGFPLAAFKIGTRTAEGGHAKHGLVMSLLILLLINLTQASWEGSVLRVWIFFIIALGIVLVRTIEREIVGRNRGKADYD